MTLGILTKKCSNKKVGMARDSHRSKIGGEFDPHRRLWAYVLFRAVLDIRHTRGQERVAAAEWFSSESYAIGSFFWITDILDLDPWMIRAKLFGG
jgi:hypothetical protein